MCFIIDETQTTTRIYYVFSVGEINYATKNTYNIFHCYFYVKFSADKQIRVIRLAPEAGLDTVAKLKAAEGYKAIKASAFTAIDPDSNGNELRYYPGVGTYSYVIEYEDGTKEFGEFVIDGAWDDEGKEPVFDATGITNMVQNRFVKAYYAPGNWNSVMELRVYAA